MAEIYDWKGAEMIISIFHGDPICGKSQLLITENYISATA